MLLSPKPTLSPTLTAVQRAQIAAHYRLAAPLLMPLFGQTPFVYGTYPEGLDGAVVWHGSLRPPPPPDVPTCSVASHHGVSQYLAFGEPAVRWVLRHTPAVELHGWGCTATDPQRARFARILLELDAKHDTALTLAATVLKHLLRESNLQAVPMLQGTRGIALWIPLSGGPRYEVVRAWLHELCSKAAGLHPTLFSLAPNTHVSGRVHLNVGSNAPGRYSALPYSLRGDDALRVCTPVLWNELSWVRDGLFTAHNFARRLATGGDVFAAQIEAIGEQSFPQSIVVNGKSMPPPAHRKPFEPHGRILRAAGIVLRDGRPRDAKTILTEALAKHLVPAPTKENYVYTSLLEYIVRTSGHGHKPLIVQDVDRRFRLNEPRDDWPPTDPPPIPPVDAVTQAILDRLASTAAGDDPRAFEIAVCDAFAHVGFITTHLGGNDNPDGYADAPLGSLGYRTMLECKRGGDAEVKNPDAVEASKYKESYGAQVCALVGSSFRESLELTSELQTHGVSAWSIADLQQIVRVRANPFELRPLFEPGFASDHIGDLLWNRLHGAAKRVQIVCDYIAKAGWEIQVAFAKANRGGATADAPLLNADGAILLVDQQLAEAGSSASCSRADVSAAFAYLTSPLVGTAIRTSALLDAPIVIVNPPP